MATTQKGADVLKARLDLLQAFQAAAVGGGSSRGALNKAVVAAAAAALIGERENLPWSRGLDERGAHAKADVRKRAAATKTFTFQGEMEGMIVNEYGHNATYVLTGLMRVNNLTLL
ncbi:hypothetical protein KP509_07G022600 [Ceratopteris richardii]|uniref:Uncharacterized protein n=1 Tax=Ceratopteris richardii TaxID=49495 RepID=A0A8T2UEY2_CERRI|nr:hypothetical protein KP509_07G022600 [Ceratopteris richardii]